MDFRQLEYICAVHEHQSITKAAVALYISQPSLSHFIAKTEEDLGVKLFDRSTSPISLTYAGEQYIQNAKRILKMNEDMRKQFRDIACNMVGRLRIGMPQERSAYMLPLILPAYKEVYPGIEVKLFTGGSKDLFKALDKGQIDFLILPHHIIEKGMRAFTIYEEELVLVAAKGMIGPQHLVDGYDNTVDLSRIGDIPLITLNKGRAIRETIDTLLAHHKVQPAIFMELTSNITATRMAAAGLGFTLIPRMTIALTQCQKDYDIFSIGVPPVTWEVRAIFREDAYIGLAEKAFLEIARRICQ